MSAAHDRIQEQALGLMVDLEDNDVLSLPDGLQDILLDLRYALNMAWPGDTSDAHGRAVARYRSKNPDKVREWNREAQRRRRARLKEQA